MEIIIRKQQKEIGLNLELKDATMSINLSPGESVT